MPNNDVSIEPVALYYGQKAVASTKESLNDLSLNIGNMDPIVVSNNVELSTIGLIDETKNLINSTNQDFEEVEEKITNVINGMKKLDPMIAMLFDYYDEQDITLDELLSDIPEEVNEARSIAEIQEDAFAEVDYYDQYIEENNPRLSELHKQISALDAQITDIEWQTNSGLPLANDDYENFANQKAERIEEILQAELPKTTSGVEAKEYIETALNNNGLDSEIIDWSVLYVQENGWVESVYVMKYKDENGNIKCFMYGPEAGKAIMSEAEYNLIHDESFDIAHEWKKPREDYY